MLETAGHCPYSVYRDVWIRDPAKFIKKSHIVRTAFVHCSSDCCFVPCFTKMNFPESRLSTFWLLQH